jgi:high-affinity nickel permease
MLMFLWERVFDRNVAKMMSVCWVMGRGFRLMFVQNSWYVRKPVVYFFCVDGATDCEIRLLAVSSKSWRSVGCRVFGLLV